MGAIPSRKVKLAAKAKPKADATGKGAAAARKPWWHWLGKTKSLTSNPRPIPKIEFAVFTLKFRKPGNARFSQNDKSLCIKEGKAALTELFTGFLKTKVAEIEVKCVASGDGTFWVDFAILVGVLARLAPTLNLLGLGLEWWGSGYEPKPILVLVKSGKWLQGVAWRVTPHPGSPLGRKRPRCFGMKEWLDRRTKRCRLCGFRSKCTKRIGRNIGT